jgi:hypothetical protein
VQARTSSRPNWSRIESAELDSMYKERGLNSKVVCVDKSELRSSSVRAGERCELHPVSFLTKTGSGSIQSLCVRGVSPCTDTIDQPRFGYHESGGHISKLDMMLAVICQPSAGHFCPSVYQCVDGCCRRRRRRRCCCCCHRRKPASPGRESLQLPRPPCNHLL